MTFDRAKKDAQVARWSLRSHRSALIRGNTLSMRTARMQTHPSGFASDGMTDILRLAKASVKRESSAR